MQPGAVSCKFKVGFTQPGAVSCKFKVRFMQPGAVLCKSKVRFMQTFAYSRSFITIIILNLYRNSIRYLTQLIFVEDLTLDKRNKYVDFIEQNAQNLWSSSTIYEPHILYSHAWYHPNGEKQKTWLRGQISGVTLIEAVALLEKEGLLD